ncbi:diiron oxygenase [Kutzneria sp. NPDC052558]|uniref:diiron oxygenase n=1 Tax=Kutzneria sp. NPDC052558 TaxID=3364121 RepID=UPI0037CCB650
MTEVGRLDDGDYRSGFARWDERSWVRAKPRRGAEFEPGKHFFSPDLCVPLAHPRVLAAPRGVREALLVHNLYIYLEFTVRLEMGPVNETCALLHSPAFLPWLPPGMKADALRIYTDEAGHAEMSNTLLAAVHEATGIAPIAHEPAFLGDLRRLYAAEPPVYRPLLKMFFTVVSETLITGSLTKLPKDPSVQRAVREVAQDHATDEGLHHAYFRRLFDLLWPRLPIPLRRKIGVLLPVITNAFLRPDEAALRAALHDVRFPDADRVAAESVALPAVRAAVADNAAPTIRMLCRGGVFEDPVVREAFRAAGLPTELAGRS